MTTRSTSDVILAGSAVALGGLMIAGSLALMRDFGAGAVIVSVFALAVLAFYYPSFKTVRELRESDDALDGPVWQLSPLLAAALLLAAVAYAVWRGSVGLGAWALLSGALLNAGVVVRRFLEIESAGRRVDATFAELARMSAPTRWRVRWLARRRPPPLS